MDRNLPLRIQTVQIVDLPFLKHLEKAHENLRRAGRIVHSTVMIQKRHTQRLGHRIQLEPVQAWQQEAGHSHRIHGSEIRFISKIPTVLFDKAHIKGRVVSHHDCSSGKLQKFRQHLIDGAFIDHHGVIDPGEVFYFKGDGNLRIDKRRKPVGDLSFLHPHGADLDDFVGCGTKSRSFNVKYHKGTVQTLPFAVFHDSLQIIHQIGLHTVDHLKGTGNLFQFFFAHIGMVFCILIPVGPVDILQCMVGLRE